MGDTVKPRGQGRDRRGAALPHTDYFAGKLTDQSYDEKELAMALAGLPSVPA